MWPFVLPSKWNVLPLTLGSAMSLALSNRLLATWCKQKLAFLSLCHEKNMPWVTEQSQENEKHLEDAWTAEIIQAAPFGLNLKTACTSWTADTWCRIKVYFFMPPRFGMACYVAVFCNSWLILVPMESRTGYKLQVETWHLVCNTGYLQLQSLGIVFYQCDLIGPHWHSVGTQDSLSNWDTKWINWIKEN